MNKTILSIAVITGIIMSGCLPQVSKPGAATLAAVDTSWEPAVDPHGDANAPQIKPDLAECKQLAAKAASGSQAEVASAAGAGPGLLEMIRDVRNIANVARLDGLTATDYGLNSLGRYGSNSNTTTSGSATGSKYKSILTECMAKRGHNILG